MTSLLIGRFQPLHEGHIQLVKILLSEGRKVVIGLRDGQISPVNPYSVEERTQMFRDKFGDRITVIATAIVSCRCHRSL
jgi:nicotinamide-nucleotide adenylyltransferase